MTTQPVSRGFTAGDYAAIAMMNLMWGLNLIAVKMAVDLIQPMTAAFLRQVMVLLICLPALKIVPGRMRELIALGVLSGGLFYMFVNGSLAVADNVAALAIAGQLGAPFSLILAVIFLKERVQAIRIAGMALAFAGVATLVFDPAAMHEQWGIFLTACSSVIWAVCSLIQRRLSGVPVLTIYAWIGLIGALILAPVALMFEPQSFFHLPSLPLSALSWVLFSALGSTVIGQGAMSWLFQRHPVSTVIPMTLVTPVIAVGVSAWWFHTPVTLVMVIGGIMVLCGVAVVTIRTANARENKGVS